MMSNNILLNIVLFIFIKNKTVSSRMHTPCLKTIHASVSVVATRCHSGRVVRPQTNKFEQVSSAHHQMSLAGRGKVPKCDVSGGMGQQLPTVADRGGQEDHAPPRPC